MRKAKILSITGPILGLSTGLASAIGMKLMDGSLGKIDPTLVLYGGLTVGGGIAVNLLSNTAQNICNAFSRKISTSHPDEHNLDLRKTLLRAIEQSLSNILFLYRQQKPSGKDLSFVRECIADIEEQLKDTYNTDVYDIPDDARIQVSPQLRDRLHDAGLPEEFIALFIQSYPAQLKLCFSEQLQDKDNHKAWVAFQQTMFDSASRDLEDILAGQSRIENSILELKAPPSGKKMPRLSGKNAAALRIMLEELRQPHKIRLQLEKELDELAGVLKTELAEIKQLNVHIYDELKSFRSDYSQGRTDWWSRKMVIAYSIVVALVAGLLMIRNFYLQRPFIATVVLHGPKGEGDNVLAGRVTVEIVYSDRKEEEAVNEKGEALFKNIPSVYRGDSITIHVKGLEGEPYRTACGTCRFKLEEHAVLKIPLAAEGMDRIQGIVLDENRKPIPGTVIIVQNIKTITDANGLFVINIPPDRQKRLQDITAVKNGYKEQKVTGVSSHTQTGPNEIMLFKIQ